MGLNPGENPPIQYPRRTEEPALERASFLWWEQPSLAAVDLLELVIYDTFVLVGTESAAG